MVVVHKENKGGGGGRRGIGYIITLYIRFN